MRCQDKKAQIHPPLQVHHTVSMETSSNSARHPKFWTFPSPTASVGDRNRSHFLLITMQMRGMKFACWAELIPANPSAGAVITNYRQASDGRRKPRILSGGVFYLRGGIPIRPTGQTERYCSSIVMCPVCRHFQMILILSSLPQRLVR